MTDKPTKLHSITRTSPKGEAFVGTCSLCGQANLTIRDMRTKCTNQRGMTESDALIETIER